MPTTNLGSQLQSSTASTFGSSGFPCRYKCCYLWDEQGDCTAGSWRRKEQAELNVGIEGGGLAWLAHEVSPQIPHRTWTLNLNSSKALVAGTRSTASPVTSRGKFFTTMIGARQMEIENQAPKARAKTKPDAGKQNAAEKASISSASTTSTSRDGEQRPCMRGPL